MASAMRTEAFPSPYGFEALDIFRAPLDRWSNSCAKSYMVCSSVPANLKVPAVIPSGRSVVSLKTRTGTPVTVPSSWIPQESVKIRKALRSEVAAKSNTSSGSIEMNPQIVPENFVCQFLNKRI